MSILNKKIINIVKEKTGEIKVNGASGTLESQTVIEDKRLSKYQEREIKLCIEALVKDGYLIGKVNYADGGCITSIFLDGVGKEEYPSFINGVVKNIIGIITIIITAIGVLVSILK